LAEIVRIGTTTTRALRAMEECKLLTRRVLDEPYRPVSYSLTERGKKLSELLGELEKL
jgi:DNA-binding HxlR family transcriptional regulator